MGSLVSNRRRSAIGVMSARVRRSTRTGSVCTLVTEVEVAKGLRTWAGQVLGRLGRERGEVQVRQEACLLSLSKSSRGGVEWW